MKKKGLKIGTQITLGFWIFLILIVALLWLMQTVFLRPFYRGVKTAQVRAIAESVQRELETEELDERVKNLANDTGMAILVTDEFGTRYSGYKASQRESLIELMDRTTLRTFFDEVNQDGGSRLAVYASPYTYLNGERSEVLLYAKICRSQSGNPRMILIESEITPVSAVVDTLRIQLIAVTVIMAVLGSFLAFFIARRISKPVTDINEAAKGLAQGYTQIHFPAGGTREVNELGETLNYAASEIGKAENLRRELLANVSHDLRTPLTMIEGYAEVMRDIPGENTPENVQIIIDEAGRLTALVNDLLDLSKFEAGEVSLKRERFNLTAEVRDILTRFDKMADFTFPFDAGEEVWVYADRLMISQVVYNLVNNAVSYSGEDKTVYLRQEIRGSAVRISVEDHGEGIPPDKLKDIWERYYKVDREHRRSRAGTGLGLSIVRNILTLHGGTYGVESVLGQGSTFWFELPLAPSENSDYNREQNDSLQN